MPPGGRTGTGIPVAAAKTKDPRYKRPEAGAPEGKTGFRKCIKMDGGREALAHFIGHLQKNKVKYVVESATLSNPWIRWTF